MEREKDIITHDPDYIAGMVMSVLNHTDQEINVFEADGLKYYDKKQKIFLELLAKSGYKIISL